MKIFANNIIDITQFQSDHIITIDVNYLRVDDEEELQIAAASDISDSIPKEEFDEFVENVMGYIFQRDFIIEDEHGSNRDGSVSYYATFYPTDEDGNLRDKYLVFFRLSDHKSRSDKDSNLRRRNYHKAIAKKFKRSDDEFQEWRFRDIVIGSKAYPSYNKALDAIADMLNKMKHGSYFE